MKQAYLKLEELKMITDEELKHYIDDRDEEFDDTRSNYRWFSLGTAAGVTITGLVLGIAINVCAHGIEEDAERESAVGLESELSDVVPEEPNSSGLKLAKDCIYGMDKRCIASLDDFIWVYGDHFDDDIPNTPEERNRVEPSEWHLGYLGKVEQWYSRDELCGKVTTDPFCMAAEQAETVLKNELFPLYDIDGNGVIDENDDVNGDNKISLEDQELYEGRLK